MSAQLIFDSVPLGALIQYSDGSPRPPARHRKKLAAWENRNSRGRLIRKRAETVVGSTTLPASITLHKGDFGGSGVIVLRVHQTFSVNGDLTFTVVEMPKAGSVQVLDRAGDHAELVHLAESREAADAWLKGHGYPHAVLRAISADEATAGAVVGRAAA
ncbi:hypothetical protein [Roseixanthobacter glucoisosaccharinicivorans]|uniref:hypothetical protein n=1 Tax=Roseixanthobacter glucoisosaccharinicivorans TaxID=3119923 RepID=UPI00372C6DA8